MPKMDKSESAKVISMPCKGYWSTLGGVELKHIEHGIEDYILCVANAWYGTKSAHRVKVQYTKDNEARPYIVLYHYKLYLDECFRA